MNDKLQQKKAKAFQKQYISCVVPVYNEESIITDFIEALHQCLIELHHPFEIIVVDDGSQDQTQIKLKQLKEKYAFHYIRLSRNFGKESALSAGIHHAKGEAVILLDADFQHPLNLIPQFIQKWQEGYDMVYAVRKNRSNEPWVKRICTKMFYQLTSKINQIHIPANAGDFRLLNRKMTDALLLLPERNRFMKGLYSWVGFKQIAIPFDVHPRSAGKSRWNFSSLLNLAITGITSFSAFPLRMIAIGGISIATVALIATFWIIIKAFLFGLHTPGWAALIATISFFGGLQLFAIGVVGEYIGRIFDEVKQRPNYIIDKASSFNAD